MTQQIINVGNTTNDGTGDTLRVGAQKINNNFTELYGTVNYLSNYTFSIPTASTSVAGLVKVDGSSITITSGTISATPYTLPTATTSVLGGVKVDGTSVTISNGVISATAPYVLPTATTSVLGGVKIDGTTITISNGVISSAAAYSLPTATTSVLGGVKVDGSTISINGSGVISASAPSVPLATNSTVGVVRPDNSTITVATGGILSVAAGTGLSTRSSNSITTAALLNDGVENTVITGFKSYVLLKVQTSAAAWVRIYTSVAARTADVARSITTDPSPGSGVVAEFITTGAQTIAVTPTLIGFNDEATPITDIPITVVNKSGGTTAITVSLTVLKLEA